MICQRSKKAPPDIITESKRDGSPLVSLKMKTPLKTALIAFLCAASLQADDTLPPASVRGDWKELAESDFDQWTISKFTGWDTPFDGGSKVFFFETDSNGRFDIMAANPAYWTADDKKQGIQVFYLIHKGQFFRLEPKSEQEKSLIRMLREAQPRLVGKDRTDPGLLLKLVETLEKRAPMFKTKN